MTELAESLTHSLYGLRRALCRIASVIEAGKRRHPDDAGFRQTPQFHVAKAQRHLEALTTGDRTEPHLEHAAARLLLAIEVSLK